MKINNLIAAASLVPATGDESNVGMWVGILIAAVAGMALLLILLLKKPAKQEDGEAPVDEIYAEEVLTEDVPVEDAPAEQLPEESDGE